LATTAGSRAQCKHASHVHSWGTQQVVEVGRFRGQAVAGSTSTRRADTCQLTTNSSTLGSSSSLSITLTAAVGVTVSL